MPSTKIEKFFAERGAQATCEVCGSNRWSLTDDDQPMTVRLVTQTPPAPANKLLQAMGMISPPVSLPDMGSITAYVSLCLNCGNIRLHSEAVVKGPAGL